MGESSSVMAAAAARDALTMAGLTPGDRTAMIGASSTPQQAIPCTAVFVQRELGAPEGLASCFDVNATCLSFLAAFDVAARLVLAGAHRHVLVCSSENVSHSMNPEEPERAARFGDAAAAVIVSHAGGSGSALHVMKLQTWHSGAEPDQRRWHAASSERSRDHARAQSLRDARSAALPEGGAAAAAFRGCVVFRRGLGA